MWRRERGEKKIGWKRNKIVIVYKWHTMIINAESLKESTFHKLISNYSKVVEDKVNIWVNHFYINEHEQEEFDL
jgi:hypothetical protein